MNLPDKKFNIMVRLAKRMVKHTENFSKDLEI